MEREQLSKRAANIFVNYRRDDSAGHAGRLFDRLNLRFPGRVFMDVDTIEPGIDFAEVIEQAVGCCEVLIVVIGREWLFLKDSTGQRRLDSPNDFVRLEIGAALERHIRVIPVLVEGAAMPRPEELPPDLLKLTRRNAIELSDARWSFDVDRLIQTIEGVLQYKAPSALLPATTAPVTPAPAPTPVPAPAPEKTRTLTWLIPAVLVLLALAGWGGWKFGNRPDPQPTGQEPEEAASSGVAVEAPATTTAAVLLTSELPPEPLQPVASAPKPRDEEVVQPTKPSRREEREDEETGDYGPDTCKKDFVWREARSGDRVCVTPETRRQVREDNRLARGRRDPSDPNKCLPGYVWREAFEGDRTCVTPESRDQAQLDNSQADDRRMSLTMRKILQGRERLRDRKGNG